ncbi:hypothetical protein [Burkholderia sp. Ac-20365]|uniref:hypothetical protein n=1 Tax=Burkholderia sp. Ac-20365 TaxID=2703897 RepID=UPI00197C0567|nr:hypothetical protein [Burkholderia sp. Ac-20365]MBN3761078.1 hypothetical protein [Burkholderia sp. Ac-20365]
MIKSLLRAKKSVEPRDLPTFEKSVWSALFGRWVWKVDGSLALVVLLAYMMDRFSIGVGYVLLPANLLAIISFGVILKRNLKRDVRWRDLPAIIREARTNTKGEMYEQAKRKHD